LGAAIIAGVGSGVFSGYASAVEAMVKLERTFTPDMARHRRYTEWFGKYQQLAPLMQDYLRDLAGG
ncbi:MAG: carbohydrate kinase, partial [Anaerolineae bacterium]|nr:carbohydrate kinase [Anaerolineae bacterium]